MTFQMIMYRKPVLWIRIRAFSSDPDTHFDNGSGSSMVLDTIPKIVLDLILEQKILDFNLTIKDPEPRQNRTDPGIRIR